MRDPTFMSPLMWFRIEGTTVRYCYTDDGRPTGRWYEIRDVQLHHLVALRATIGSDRFSSSATVQALTHLYESSHFHGDGRRAEASSQPLRRLLPKTPPQLTWT